MRFPRLHPLDLAAAAVAMAGIAFVLATVRGQRLEGTASGGFLRVERVVVTLVVSEPALARIASSSLRPGPLQAETARGPEEIEVLSVEPSTLEPGVLVRVALPASVDRSARAFFNERRLRVGERFTLATADIAVSGVIADLERPERHPR